MGLSVQSARISIGRLKDFRNVSSEDFLECADLELRVGPNVCVWPECKGYRRKMKDFRAANSTDFRIRAENELRVGLNTGGQSAFVCLGTWTIAEPRAPKIFATAHKMSSAWG